MASGTEQILSPIVDPLRPGDLPDHRTTWQHEMKSAVRDAYRLCRELGLPEELAEKSTCATGDFPLFAPYPFIRRIRRGDPNDPLLRQILPVPDEQRLVPGFEFDPVADLASQIHPGVIHKYQGRALLVAAGACAVHCRYCFRRYFPYTIVPRTLEQWHKALEPVAHDTSIHEMILSGGDPLTLSDEQLLVLVDQLGRIPHLRRLRVHTRLPVVIPRRVTSALLDILRSTHLTTVVVLHINHAQEIDSEVISAVRALRSAETWLLNQAVLLRGVNDSLPTLMALSESLIQLQIVPYYLHQLDRVAGAAHFEVPVRTGRKLVRQLRHVLPGYAVPRYVQDRPGELSKRWLA
jgi:EF-P beta-lysylation protein EpmB